MLYAQGMITEVTPTDRSNGLNPKQYQNIIVVEDTTAGAENRWIDSDNVRFRYGLPEKVGGWSSLISDTIVGVARKQHGFVDLDGNRYVAIGTDKFLLLYFE